jgi:hypothetical protein
MASIRAVVVEMEGTDATVLDAIRSFVGRVNGFAAVAPVERKSLAPFAAMEVKALASPTDDGSRSSVPPSPAVAKARRAPVKRAAAGPIANRPQVSNLPHKEEAAAAPKAAKELNLEGSGARAAVYAALKSGPMTSLQLIQRFSQYSNGSIYLALKELRGAMVVRTREIDGEQKNERVG